MLRNFRSALTAGIAGATLFLTTATNAAVIGFESITNNSPISAGTAGQFTLEISPHAAGLQLTLTNDGPVNSTVASIYIDDDTVGLLTSPTIEIPVGVSFSSGGSPAVLPGGNGADFEETFIFSAANPKPHNGLSIGESMSLVFGLNSGVVLADIEQAFASGNLRLGMHVIGFDNGASESFVTVVPEPATACTLLAAGGLLLRRRGR